MHAKTTHPFIEYNVVCSFCHHQEQYRMVFEAVLMFLDSFDTYANFE